MKERLLAEGIDATHLRPGIVNNPGRSTGQVPLEQVMVEQSTYSRRMLKKRLIESGMLKHECASCGQGPEWRGNELVLVLDHINGLANDHRLENLRILCPNCHSQTETYCGRNYSKRS